MRQSIRRAAIVVGLSVCGMTMAAARPAVAQQQSADPPELHPGRPGLTESAGVAGPHVVQFEGGVELDASRDGRQWSDEFVSPAVLRVGLTSRFEVRLASDGLTIDRTPSSRDAGLADLALGAKYIAIPSERAGFELAVLPSLSLPTGADAFSGHRAQPSLGLSFDREVVAHFDVAASASATWTRDPEQRRVARAASIAIGHAVAGPWSGYGEIAAADGDSGRDWLFDAGVSRPIGADAQIDMELGHRLAGGAPEWTVGAGLVIRHVGRHRR